MENDDSDSGGGVKRQQQRRWRRHQADCDDDAQRRHQEEEEEERTTELMRAEQPLPSEQDRKAIMGCLAAVLNMTFAARRRRRRPKGAAHSIVAASIQSSDVGDVKDDDDSAPPPPPPLPPPPSADFSILQRDDDSPSIESSSAHAAQSSSSSSATIASSSAAVVREEASLRRTRSFRRELLKASADLLYLSEEHAAVFLPNLDILCAERDAEEGLLLRPFLESLSGPEESFRCIALLMFRFLLSSGEEVQGEEGDRPSSKSKSNADDDDDRGAERCSSRSKIVGYDARARFAFKYLAVSVFSYWELKAHESFLTPERASARATRKFEALEDGVASRLAALSEMMAREEKEKKKKKGGRLAGRKQDGTFGQNAIRGLKIGAAGVAAGTVFAITGGLAAPAIVGGIAAMTGVSSVVTVVASILLLPAATTIFGVGGGTLVASKMSKRTAGLKEFDIVKITPDEDGGDSGTDPILSRTVCIGGWLRDEHDSERPFGVTPRGLVDRHELLCRYCSVYAPHIIPDCRRILKEWQGREDELWGLCKASYGKDPGSLLPFESGPRYDTLLTESENKAVDDLMRPIGLPVPEDNARQCSPQKDQSAVPPSIVDLLSEVLVPNNKEKAKDRTPDLAMIRLYHAWDFHAEYGSEQYVVLWEKELLLKLSGTAKKIASDLATKATKEALKKTAMASIMAAVALPAAILSLTNIIDEEWTLVAERADEAGVLLAQSLLNSNAGHRPVSLIGFSFGARMIIACLRELARNQAIWEQQQEGNVKDSVASAIRTSLRMSNKPKEAQVFTREPASIVEDVILMGCPASINSSKWLSCREMVGGRLINCYSKYDMILALMYRAKNIASSLLTPPVGISHVDVAGIENFDVSNYVASHGDYCVAVREILNVVRYNQPAHTKA